MKVEDRIEMEKIKAMSEVDRLRWALAAAGRLADLSRLLHAQASEISQGLKNMDEARMEYNRRIVVLTQISKLEKTL